jgi:hypothetical protein
MSENPMFEPVDLLRIINSYATSGATSDKLAMLYELVINHTPLLKEKESNKEKEEEYKDINKRILTIISGKSEKSRSVTDDVRGYVNDAEGEFSLAQMFSALNIMTKEEKDLARHAIKKLTKSEEIKNKGGKTGIYIKVDSKDNIIDWRNADDKEYPIKLPLNVQDLVKIYPGNIVVVAGASNTGKTSFMLETVRLNQRTHEVYYFNSEMGASELKTRLQLFSDVIALDKWKFTAIERSTNFADAIKPKALNIIDFMEVYDDFWKIGGWIRDVHAKLDGGVAIIAIQKKSSTKRDKQSYGRGGELSIEKPRLYLAMDRGRLEIIKAKAWRSHDVNPNGLMRGFNIIQGWRFRPKTEWITEDGYNLAEAKKKYQEYGVKDDDFPHEDED